MSKLTKRVDDMTLDLLVKSNGDFAVSQGAHYSLVLDCHEARKAAEDKDVEIIVLKEKLARFMPPCTIRELTYCEKRTQFTRGLKPSATHLDLVNDVLDERKKSADMIDEASLRRAGVIE